MPRLFIGIKIHEPKIIFEAQEKLQLALSRSSVKWVKKENFHLTLKFLGETDSRFIIPIIQNLEEISKRFECFILQSDDLGKFGPIQKPNTLFYSFKENPMLTSLQISIDKALNKIGFDTEKRPFKPHLTLGRCKSLYIKDSIKEVLHEKDKITHHFKICRFQLMESKLKREGPLYKTHEVFKLAENER
jgi:2'-5' RNA ligase